MCPTDLMYLQEDLGLDGEQVNVLKRCFDGFADEEGAIPAENVGNILSIMGLKFKPMALKGIIEEIDEDGEIWCGAFELITEGSYLRSSNEVKLRSLMGNEVYFEAKCRDFPIALMTRTARKTFPKLNFHRNRKTKMTRSFIILSEE